MKKIISILLCLSILLGFSCIVQAGSIDFDETISGVISENQTENKYNFELFNSGNVQLKLNAENMRRISIKIYDDAGQEVWSNTPYWNDTSKQISFSENIELTSGKYTLILSRYDGNGTYEFNLAYEDCEESFEEEQGGSNNTFKSASEINVDESYVGQIAINDETDIYKFTLDNSGGLVLSLNAENMRRLNMKFYDNDGQEIWNNTPYWNDTSKRISFSENIELTSGTYYFSVSRYDGNGTYEFNLVYEDCGESFEEGQGGSNNTFKSASEIDVDESYVGQIAINDETDIYKFTLGSSGGFVLSLNAENMRRLNMKFYDNDGQEIWNNTPYWNDTSKRISFSENIELTSGTYYFSVSRYDGNGTYEFNLAYEDCEESFGEKQNGSNNTFKSASEIDVDEKYVGQIAINDETDIYKFTLDNSGGLVLSLNAENMRRLNMKFYNNDGQEIWDNTPYWNDTSKRISFSEDITLTDGTYYFSVSKYDGYGTYEFSLNTKNNVTTPIQPYEAKDELINGDDKSQENTIKIRTSNLSIFINGEKVNFPDARPFIDSADRTQVPVRFVAEEMGYVVEWIEPCMDYHNGAVAIRPENNELYIMYEGEKVYRTLFLSIGSNQMIVSHEDGPSGTGTHYLGSGTIYMDTTAILKDDRTYIPLRYVAEALGYTVEWE